MTKKTNRWMRLNDLLRLDFLLGTGSGIFVAISILRRMEQSDPGSTADCPFTFATLIVSGVLAWLIEVFFSRRG